MDSASYHCLKDQNMLFKLLGEEFSILKNENKYSQSHLSKSQPKNDLLNQSYCI